MFEPGTLQVVTLPAGADASNSSSTGGADGTGVVDVRSLSLPARNDTLVVEFEIQLAPVIAYGTYVTNQAQLRIDDVTFALSDDPNVNGAADPRVAGDEDPTRVLIESAPDFRLEKVSAYVTGDPNVLLAGETLRYTITAKNVGTADAVDAMLRDPIPVNTRYVAGSTTLNGAPVADGPGGLAPLSDGNPDQRPGGSDPGRDARRRVGDAGQRGDDRLRRGRRPGRARRNGHLEPGLRQRGTGRGVRPSLGRSANADRPTTRRATSSETRRCSSRPRA